MSSPATPTQQPPRNFRSFVRGFVLLLVAMLLLGSGVVLIHTRAVATVELPSSYRVTVQASAIERSHSYEVERHFVGLVESSQHINVAFESGGTVSTVLVQEGDLVQVGDVLATLDQRSLKAKQEQVLAARRAAQVTLERAELALQRERELEISGFPSQESLDNAGLSVQAAKAAVAQIDAQLRDVIISLGKSQVKSPFNATVGERLVDAGSIVANGQSVLRLYEKNKLTARIGIPADLPIQWQRGQTAKFNINGQIYTGRYLSQRPDVSLGTRVIETRFDLLHEGNEWPVVGQMAQLRWQETKFVSGYWVPVSALSEGKRGLWSVLRLSIDENSTKSDSQDELATVVREHVELIHTDGERAYVQGAMPDWVQIVTDGNHRIVAEQRVLTARISD